MSQCEEKNDWVLQCGDGMEQMFLEPHDFPLDELYGIPSSCKED